MGLIDDECFAVDGSIVKAHSNNFWSKLKKSNFYKIWFLIMVETGVKTVFGTKSIDITMKLVRWLMK